MARNYTDTQWREYETAGVKRNCDRARTVQRSGNTTVLLPHTLKICSPTVVMLRSTLMSARIPTILLYTLICVYLRGVRCLVRKNHGACTRLTVQS